MSSPVPGDLAGSSPHTRGLRGGPGLGCHRQGIIPAHAGFTTGPRACAPRTPDHPRTRGVYLATVCTPVMIPGSSPHTRGLPIGELIGLASTGIIPAHAGFTGRGSGRNHDVSDHPRTRGVYGRGGAFPWPGGGSSPHTRGLRQKPQKINPKPRIIPAHAGFTAGVQPRVSRPPDHPRTRGVYRTAIRKGLRRGGSSPHTRGLLSSCRSTTVQTRIIPAHAGFTIPRGLFLRQYGDHPRTRGVYAGPTTSYTIGKGSSPHTRGLPSRREPRGDSCGIIPAHAGFTGATHRPESHLSDHPRTRGVYCDEPCPGFYTPGSSPHTRGLLATIMSGRLVSGIIPAHAGFTPSGTDCTFLAEDHPRTRGVYFLMLRLRVRPLGSSPHTRGLLRFFCPCLGHVRIIPAHAGFTDSPRRILTISPDHPRTRGVYFLSPRWRMTALGSSPHTRGLPIPVLRLFVVVGIIPAHAGFTHGAVGDVSGSWDHPRTRGVYTHRNEPRTSPGGSSPHTRGLLLGVVIGCSLAGIIPAHAGFTVYLSLVGVCWGDHPRTRGVYAQGYARHYAEGGSSPHTRGLRR